MEIDQEKKAEQENGQGKSYLSIDDGDHAVLAYNGSAVYIPVSYTHLPIGDGINIIPLAYCISFASGISLIHYFTI